jgi:hypothetical protein
LGSAAAVEDRINLPFEEIRTEPDAFQGAPFGCSLDEMALEWFGSVASEAKATRSNRVGRATVDEDGRYGLAVAR